MASNNKNITFRGTISLAFVKADGTREAIDSNRIVYINISYDYFNKVIPIVIMSLSVSTDMYSKMLNNQETSRIYLSISGSNVLSRRALSKQRLSGMFRYIPSSTNQPFDISTTNNAVEDTYVGITLGLVDADMISKMRQTFNGVYYDTSLKEMVALAIGGLNVCYEPIHNDYIYNQLVVPACNSRYKFLEFLFKKDQFYNTYFRFFMDFNRTYLLSLLGNGVKTADGTVTDVILDIRPVTEEVSFTDGFEMKNGAYYIYLNQVDVNININTSRDQFVNKIVSYGDDQNSITYSFDDENNGNKTLFIRSNYDDSSGNIYKEQIDSAKISLDLIKSNLDESIFQLNYQYTIKFYGDYSQYNGTYILSYKRVMYQASGDEFQVICNVGLVPASDNIPSGSKGGDSQTTKSKDKSASKSARKTTTSKSQNTSVLRCT